VPSAPTEEQATELRLKLDEAYERAAKAIGAADVLLLSTGAGWSADSGLPVYKDIADVAAYEARGLTYHDLCEPHWLDDEPSLFHGFWGGCFNDYRDATPHLGYSIVRSWRDARFASTEVATQLREAVEEHCKLAKGSGPGAFFSFTSNVDAHHLQFFQASEVRECHGNCEVWQCKHRDCPQNTGGNPLWSAPAGFRFHVDEQTREAAAGAAPTESSSTGASFACNHPTCAHCGGPARPAILMFNDDQWRDNVEQKAIWDMWRQALIEAVAKTSTTDQRPLRVAVLEVGAGGNVTTVRGISESIVHDVVDAGGESLLIRINPDLPLADDIENQARTISLMSRGLCAVQKIDEIMRKLGDSDRTTDADHFAGLPLSTVVAPEPEPQEIEHRAKEIEAAKRRDEDERLATKQRHDSARAAFDSADTDGDGVLTCAEAVRVASILGRIFLGTADSDKAITEMDAACTGCVSWEQFWQWWEGGGRLSAAERLDAQWAALGQRFDLVLAKALGSAKHRQ